MSGSLAHLADPSSSTSYGGLIISGVITIIVALIGAFAGRALRSASSSSPEPRPSEDEQPPRTQPVILPGEEPQWAKDLRDNMVKENNELKTRVKFLERVCTIHDIDPDTGRRLPSVDEAFPEPPPTTPVGNNQPDI